MLAELQAQFVRALRDGDEATLLPAIVPLGLTPTARIDIHRTNFLESLIEVLAAAYPVVQSLVGEPFFRGMAARYARAEPPTMAELSVYGAGFPAFIAASPEAADLPYLPDVARLEWARNEAYFAPDAAPLDPAALAPLPAERLADIRLVLHPSVRLVAAAYPIHTIWAAHQQDPVDLRSVDLGRAEQVLVCRPARHVQTVPITGGVRALLAGLGDGAALGEAAAAALVAEPGLDLRTALAEQLAAGTFGGFRLPDRDQPGGASNQPQ